MATNDVTDRASSGISKYCITFAASLAVIVLAGNLLISSYWRHASLLNVGDRVGIKLDRLGLTSQEGRQHGPR